MTRLVSLIVVTAFLTGCGQRPSRDYSTAESLSNSGEEIADDSSELLSAPVETVGAETVGEPPEDADGSVAKMTDSSGADQAGSGDTGQPDVGLSNAETQADVEMAQGNRKPETTADGDKPVELKASVIEYPVSYHEIPKWVAEGPQGAVRVSFDDLDLLKLMNLEPVPIDVEANLPTRITMLDGRRIRVRGFMMPPFATTGLGGFVLARDNELCCFGREPKVYDLIPVKLKDGQTTDYIQMRPFDVVGVLHIIPDIEAMELYYIDDAVVIQ